MPTLILQQFDRGFLRSLFWIALPIALQSMLFSSRSLVDILMLGQLGNAQVAAAGIAGKAFFVAIIMLFGVSTGGAMLTAQFWGANNKQGVREATALTVMISGCFASVAAALFLFAPEWVMGLATQSPKVIALGSEYLRITAFNLLGAAFGIGIAVGLRSMHQPGVSTFFSAIGIGANMFLNWVLIFGKFGLPAMGIKGAAWATLLSGGIELVLLASYLYGRKHLLAFNFQTVVTVCNKKDIQRFLKLSLPITFNHLAWAGGIFVYHAIIGQLGINGLAAMSVITPIESLSLAMLIGISNASAVFIGNLLGANKNDEAYLKAWAFSLLNLSFALLTVCVMFLIKQPLLNLFSGLTEDVRALTDHFFDIFAIILVLKSIPMVMIVGVLRAGGDIKFCFYQDIIAQWMIGIPVTAFCALILHWPIEWVYALLGLEELIKWFASSFRVHSRRWMNNLVA
ncbi:MATE family efflux transporter [Photobacterium angustum]|uniref:Multidrug resistance protein NorM n=1 Tax=Photobacterium angustum TaxID=661 RepID=A0A855S9X9_PHOAN|nr:MATE family efflux transporter [Photobacterium angustum]KJF80361.1 multidrug transporter MatE [Photobacterium damselae subsp. damselae]KJG30066.1 multidrug transporter MatE [Photobacterium angustum]KJG40140.1 multidrug transporter MatE [Photobacterium angustum]KJG43814.1 multidrug transporter MatE [Photobacterium angustum]KJG48482.1 multidrug transporter MatE [Photobacterium angustum]